MNELSRRHVLGATAVLAGATALGELGSAPAARTHAIETWNRPASKIVRRRQRGLTLLLYSHLDAGFGKPSHATSPRMVPLSSR